MNLETKITIYKFTPQVFTLTLNAVAELFHQGGTVIGAAYAQRTGAEAQTVALVGNSVNLSLEIGAAAHDTRQAQD